MLDTLKLRHRVYYEYEFMIGVEDVLPSYSTFADWKRNLRLLILAIAALHAVHLHLVLYSLLARTQFRNMRCNYLTSSIKLSRTPEAEL